MELFGFPLIHIAQGVDPKTGALRVAKGVIAIGNIAIGLLALGGLALGGITIGGNGAHPEFIRLLENLFPGFR